MRRLKYFNNETFESERYDASLDVWEQARRKSRLSLFALNGGQALIIAASQTLMLGMAAVSVNKGTMTLGDFILVNQFMLQLFYAARVPRLCVSRDQGRDGQYRAAFGVLEETPSLAPAPTDKALAVTEGRIRFADVGFRPCSG